MEFAKYIQSNCLPLEAELVARRLEVVGQFQHVELGCAEVRHTVQQLTALEDVDDRAAIVGVAQEEEIDVRWVARRVQEVKARVVLASLTAWVVLDSEVDLGQLGALAELGAVGGGLGDEGGANGEDSEGLYLDVEEVGWVNWVLEEKIG